MPVAPLEGGRIFEDTKRPAIVYNAPVPRLAGCFWALLAAALLLAVGSEEIPFRKHTIDQGRSESCAVADVNRDGRLDIISGENWFEAPSWTRHKFRSL